MQTEHDLHPNWRSLKDEQEAEQVATEVERSEARRVERMTMPQEREDQVLEGLDTARGRTGLHVKHGVVAEHLEGAGAANGDWTTRGLRRAEASTGTHYRGRGAEVCPISAESIFDCSNETCQHPEPGARIR